MMRVFDVEVQIMERTVEEYSCSSSWNLRAVLISLYRHHFGRDPQNHYALRGNAAEGQAWEDDQGSVPFDVCPFSLHLTQHTRFNEWEAGYWNLIGRAYGQTLTQERMEA